MSKAKVFLTNGQVFFSPLANVNNINRIYKDKVLKIEYPKPEQPTLQPTPVIEVAKTVKEVKPETDIEFIEITTEPQDETTKPADFSESQTRLKAINEGKQPIKRKPAQKKSVGGAKKNKTQVEIKSKY